jgi:hypothetical protein
VPSFAQAGFRRTFVFPSPRNLRYLAEQGLENTYLKRGSQRSAASMKKKMMREEIGAMAAGLIVPGCFRMEK